MARTSRHEGRRDGETTTYLGDPQPITETLTGFRPGGIEQFLGEELFSG